MKNIYNRFLDKVVKQGNCWIWVRAKDKDGYGYFFYDKIKGGKAHRFSWEYHNKKKIPIGKYVLHKCNSTSCVNPQHLYLGSPLQNMIDRETSGGYDIVRGENNHLSKLKESQVKLIRSIYSGKYGQLTSLAKEFSTTPANINYIVKRRNWKHL